MIKVAAYCRVSTDKDDQLNSFEAQCRYFTELIGHNPHWELHKIYADEGITGTSTKKRFQFNRMIDDALRGDFKLILTKEVSRFSRNILDTIRYTRELKTSGVAVQFLLDGINTRNPDAELYLSIMASMAQEESRKTSSRVTWGQTRQMEKGIVFGRSLLGYDVKNGVLSINPEGAEIVRLIFQKYTLEQLGSAALARFLTKNGYRTATGSTIWRASTIIKILKNEKYAGDLIQKKTFTPDYLTHDKKINRGEVPLISIENHHEPIVSRELWNMAQVRLRQNRKTADISNAPSGAYGLSGKIRCGECGAKFVVRYKYRKNGDKYRRWSCGTVVGKGAASCAIGRLIRDDEAMNLLKRALQSLSFDRNFLTENLSVLVANTYSAGEQVRSKPQLQKEIDLILRKKETMMDSYFSGIISQDDMCTMNQRYENQLKMLRNHLNCFENTNISHKDSMIKSDKTREIIEAVLNCETCSQSLCRSIVDSLRVYKDRHMELRLIGLSQVFVFSE